MGVIRGEHLVPANNIHQDAVVAALTADGWTITHDPYRLNFGGVTRLYIDLGAQRGTVAAEKGEQRIAVEVQSFLGPSPLRALQEAVGQFVVYRMLLNAQDPQRVLYMAVTDDVHDGILLERLGQFIIEEVRVRVLVFDQATKKVIKWIEPNTTAT